MSQPRSAPPELPGFHLVRGIGGGGFADVFLYNQERPFREVAVKVLRAEHLSERSLAQFATEADVMAQVSAHPYIVTIFTAGVAPDGRPFIVMEHYPNPHFGLRARGGKLPMSEVLRVGVQVASAVEAAHRAGILHRDIKPANILTSEYNRPGLTDFGISGVRSDTEMKAAAGVTLAYSSPEVLIDEHAGGTEASDIYSLCATIYSLVAGHSPSWAVGGDNRDAAVLHRVVNGTIPPLRRFDVPASLNHLLRNGLAPDPSARPTSALALARALQTIEQELSLAPTPLEIRGLPASAPGPLGREVSSDGDDLTRRATPVVVRPEPAPTPQVRDNRAVGDAPLISPLPVKPAYPPPAPHTRLDDGISGSDTVMRRPPPPPPAPTPKPSRKPLLIGLASFAFVILGGVMIGLVQPDGGDAGGTTTTVTDPRAPNTTSTLRKPDPPVVPAEIERPQNVWVTRSATGVIMISFEPPTLYDADDDEYPADYRYRIFRVGHDWEPGKPYHEVERPNSIAVLGIPKDESACYQVQSRATNGWLSEKTAPVCAPMG